MGQSDTKSGEPITIKKYANRRLYNTATSSYVTLDHLCQMVKDGQDFVVFDAKSGEDITRSVLTQIIFEQEGKGQNLLPIHFLRRLIGFYDDKMQDIVPNYLDMSMEALTKNQDKFRDRMSSGFGGGQQLRAMEEMTRANLTMFQDTWSEAMRRMMGVSGAGFGTDSTTEAPATGNGSGPAPAEDDTDIDTLKAQMAAMQKQLEELTRK